jgi:hypothetical protein
MTSPRSLSMLVASAMVALAVCPPAVRSPARAQALPGVAPSARPAMDCSGAQTFVSKGFEAPFGNAVVGLVRELAGCPSAWKLRPPPEMRGHGSVGGTPNHRLLWRTWYYGWAMRAGDRAAQAEARRLLSEFFESQFESEGQYWGETLTTSHYQIWLLGVTGARYIARHYRDQVLLDLTGKWFRRELWLYDLLARDGHVFSPGSRSSVSTVELRTVAYSLLRGKPAPNRLSDPNRPIPGRPNDPAGHFWKDVYNVGAWMLRELIRGGDDVGGAAGPDHTTEVPLLRDPLYVYTRGEDYLFVFPRLTRASDALFWTARVGGARMDAPYRKGEIKDLVNPYRTPELPGAQLVIVPGVSAEPRAAIRAGAPP